MGREGWKRMEIFTKGEQQSRCKSCEAVINQCMHAYQHIKQGQVDFKPRKIEIFDNILNLSFNVFVTVFCLCILNLNCPLFSYKPAKLISPQISNILDSKTVTFLKNNKLDKHSIWQKGKGWGEWLSKFSGLLLPANAGSFYRKKCCKCQTRTCFRMNQSQRKQIKDGKIPERSIHGVGKQTRVEKNMFERGFWVSSLFVGTHVETTSITFNLMFRFLTTFCNQLSSVRLQHACKCENSNEHSNHPLRGAFALFILLLSCKVPFSRMQFGVETLVMQVRRGENASFLITEIILPPAVPLFSVVCHFFAGMTNAHQFTLVLTIQRLMRRVQEWKRQYPQ